MSEKTDIERLYEEVQSAEDYSDKLLSKMTKLIFLLYKDNAVLRERIAADMREIERLRAIIAAVKRYTEDNK